MIQILTQNRIEKEKESFCYCDYLRGKLEDPHEYNRKDDDYVDLCRLDLR